MPIKNRRNRPQHRGRWMSMRHLWLDESDLQPLTPREREVLAWMGWGLERDEIAAQMCRSAKTVDKFRAAIMAKLGVHTQHRLMLLSYRLGLHEEVTPDGCTDTYRPTTPEDVPAAR